MPYLSRALFAFALLTIASFSGVATADDLLWATLAELTKEKGLPVNFKRASETLGLPSNSNEYPSYQVPYMTSPMGQRTTALCTKMHQK